MTVISNERAEYRILAERGFFGPDDHLYAEGSEIYFEGEPNEDMEPLNEPARKALSKYFDKLEASARKIAERAGIEYAGRPKSLEDKIALASAESRQVQTVKGGEGVPLMGGTKPDAPAIGMIGASEVPDQRGRKSGGALSIKA